MENNGAAYHSDEADYDRMAGFGYDTGKLVTPLPHAAMERNEAVVKLLLDY